MLKYINYWKAGKVSPTQSGYYLMSNQYIEEI